MNFFAPITVSLLLTKALPARKARGMGFRPYIMKETTLIEFTMLFAANYPDQKGYKPKEYDKELMTTLSVKR